MEAILLRGIERLLIALGAISFSWLGYRLFMFGHDKGRGHIETDSKLVRIVFSGTGPGLFFMAFGAIIMIFALLTGGATNVSQQIGELKTEIIELRSPINNVLQEMKPISDRVKSLEELLLATDQKMLENENKLKVLEQILDETIKKNSDTGK